jgi:hypothetical protein
LLPISIFIVISLFSGKTESIKIKKNSMEKMFCFYLELFQIIGIFVSLQFYTSVNLI